MRTSPYHPTKKTVLIPQGSSSSQLSSDHPLFYVRQKNFFLQQLSNKISTENKFNQMDLKRNFRIGHYVEEHNKICQNITKQQKRQNMFLNSNQFAPIVGPNDEQKRRKKQQQKMKKLQEELYNSYIERSLQQTQQPQQDFNVTFNNRNGQNPQQPHLNNSYHTQQLKEYQMTKPQGRYTVLTAPTLLQQKQLYYLDLQIGKLHQEQKLNKLVEQKHTTCSNPQLLSKISNSIMSSYMVYFDEIYALLIDELLEEEVVYLNQMEAEFYVGEGGNSKKENSIKGKGKTTAEMAAEVKRMKMMELVRQLDELADD